MKSYTIGYKLVGSTTEIKFFYQVLKSSFWVPFHWRSLVLFPFFYYKMHFTHRSLYKYSESYGTKVHSGNQILMWCLGAPGLWCRTTLISSANSSLALRWQWQFSQTGWQFSQNQAGSKNQANMALILAIWSYKYMSLQLKTYWNVF